MYLAPDSAIARYAPIFPAMNSGPLSDRMRDRLPAGQHRVGFTQLVDVLVC
jgi:hypothetical protein